MGVPKADRLLAHEHSQATFGVHRAGDRPQPHCPQKTGLLLGPPGASMLGGPTLLPTSPPLPRSLLGPFCPRAGGHGARAGFGGGLTSRGAGLVRGCRGCRGCRGSAASGSGCSETGCKARCASAASVGAGRHPSTGCWGVRRGPGAKSRGGKCWRGDKDWSQGTRAGGSRQGGDRGAGQSRRGSAGDSRATAGAMAVAGGRH